MKRTIRKTNKFDSVSIGLASPEDVLSWSFGEVTKAETINYRTQRAERDGLFCPRIFGPEASMECSCGKYKGAQYHGIICDKCDVEVTHNSVRRERMGHIELAAPIAHFWYFRKIPSRIATLLGLPTQQLQNVVYYSSYYVVSVDEAKKKDFQKKIKEEFDIKAKKAEQKETREMLTSLYKDRVSDLNSIEENIIIDEKKYDRLSKQFPNLFVAEKGGEVIYNLLKNLSLPKMEKKILVDIETASMAQKEKLQKQLIMIRNFIKSGNKPEWMFVTRLPVIPPAIRPVVALDGGRYASSDLNDLYRHIVVRNNRLKEFIETKAPKIFINTQKRLLQEAVDALFDKNTSAAEGPRIGKSQKKVLKPIAEYIGGKSGYFRSNLLGKRVDFTGRTVIVVGPHLKINQFGIPKEMALEIFRPFIIAEALQRELAYNVRGAQRLIDAKTQDVYEMLEKVIKGKYMLLNRAPTLHRQSLQAFEPILIEGYAIELHPLVCEGYNADFDGDAMIAHLPLSYEAQEEAKKIIVSSNNIVKPSSGEINATPSKDMALGCYWATMIVPGSKGEGKYFGSSSEAITAYDFGSVDLRAKISILVTKKEKHGKDAGKVIETSVGRILFNTVKVLPEDYLFVNEAITKKVLKGIINDIFHTYSREVLVNCLDTIKNFGFKYATKSGVTFSWDNLIEPGNRNEIIKRGFEKSREIYDQYDNGYIALDERKRTNISLWQGIKNELGEEVKNAVEEDSSISDLVISGARGSFDDLGDMVGIFGIVDSASGEPIEQPITSSIKKGLHPIEYFNASFGARKGLADTALKTADAGYLSRKLFDVAQEIYISGTDCGTSRGYKMYKKTASGAGEDFSVRILGRYVSENIEDAKGNVIVKKNHIIDEESAKKIEKEESIESIKIRSPITCTYTDGICARCYGTDRTTNEVVDMGEPVGTIAAQSIGEPGTQLTMRTFHAGGIASVGGDITQGLPRVTEIFERRVPKSPAIIAHVNGHVESIEQHPNRSHTIHLITDKKSNTSDIKYNVPANRFIEISVGDEVKKGQFLTDGSADLKEMLEYKGKEDTQEYIFNEISKVYELQGVSISSVHFEIIIRQMFSRQVIKNPGAGNFIEGEVVEKNAVSKLNEEFEKEGKETIETNDVVTRITDVSRSRNSFLSAASFEHTTSVLINAAISGSKDDLSGTKENVIIGRLVPIGSGFEGSKKYKFIEKIRQQVAEELAKKEEEQA